MKKEIKLDEKKWKHKYKVLLKDWGELGKRYWQLEIKFKHFLKEKDKDNSLKILNDKVNDLKKNQVSIIDCINILGEKLT